MKKALPFVCIACLVWLGVVTLFAAVYCLSPVLLRSGVSCGRAELGRFCDFTMRMNEAECLRKGVDPYDVWAERVSLPPYVSSTPHSSVAAGCTEPTNAYVPWEYAPALPLSMLPRCGAWITYCLFMLFAAAGALLLPIATGDQDRKMTKVLTSAAALAVVSYPLWSNAGVGNLAVFSLVGAVGMAWCLNRGNDVWAGMWWAVVMLKPQLGLLFALPLLMRLKWKTCLVAVLVCVICSLPSVFLCGKSLVTLITQAPAASAHGFEGCGTWPKFMCGTLGNGLDIVAGTLVGALVCLLLTAMLRKERNWFVFLMPAAIISCCWTYTQAFSHAMGWFVAFVLVRDLIRFPSSRFLWLLTALAVFSLSRWFLAWHGMCAYAGWTFPMSEYAFRCVDSLNSTLSLAIATVFCIWKRRTSRAVCSDGSVTESK